MISQKRIFRKDNCRKKFKGKWGIDKMSLLDKILGRKKGPKIETTMDADTIKPFFKANGIDMETIGFPQMETRHNSPTNAYHASFSNVKAMPLLVDDKFKVSITGNYATMAKASYTDSSGGWHQGLPQYYSFRITDNKLDCRRLWVFVVTN